MKGILGRVGERRTDIPWTEERLDPELAALVRGYHSEQRPRLLALLEQYPEKRKLVFQTRGQADQWLSEYDRESKKHGDAAADPGCDPGDG